MRDEIFGRMWVDHHENFSRDVDRGLARLRGALHGGLGRLLSWDGSTAHLLALLASVTITGLTFNNTAV